MMSPLQQKAYQGDEVGEGFFRWKSTTQMADELPDLGGSHVQIELGRELMTDSSDAEQVQRVATLFRQPLLSTCLSSFPIKSA